MLALCGPCSEAVMLAYSIHKLYKAIYTVGPLQRCHAHTFCQHYYCDILHGTI